MSHQVQEMPSKVWNDLRLQAYAVSTDEKEEGDEAFVGHIYIYSKVKFLFFEYPSS